MFDLSSYELTSTEGAVYRLTVAAPKGPAPEAGWPVIFLMDGDAWAPLAAAIIGPNLYFSIRSRMEPAVVVGVGYPNGEAFDLSRRHHDLTTPSTMPNPGSDFSGGESGGFEVMLRFIEEVVKPGIEARFPIDRARQTLGGHSLGGLFALRVLLGRPAAFQTYLALSPSIWWDHAALLKDAAARVSTPEFKAARVYIGVGDLEEHSTSDHAKESEAVYRRLTTAQPALLRGRTFEAYMADADAFTAGARMVGNARKMARLLASLVDEVRCDVFHDEDHFSVVPAEFSRGLAFALQGREP